MRNWLKNIWLYLKGFRRLKRLKYKSGWTPTSFLFKVYLPNIGACVLFLGGAVEPISTFSQRHRDGLVWDKLLDIIEEFDEDHGEKSMGALWSSVECTERFRKGLAVLWLLIFLIIAYNVAARI